MTTSIIFGGCKKDDDDGSSSIKEIKAKIENASEFSDVVKVKIRAWDSNDNEIVLATADFKDDGFTLNLPETVNSSLLQSVGDGAPSSLTISNKNAKIFVFESVIGYNKDDEVIAYFWHGKEEANSGSACMYFYVDSDLKITGTEKDSGTDWEETMVFSLVLKKGWNVVYETWSYTEQGDKEIYKAELRTSPAIGGIKWFGEKEW